ncbi:MAG: hypothetical protein ACRD4R_08650 [Candidatus Acidiferrales bacterium]
MPVKITQKAFANLRNMCKLRGMLLQPPHPGAGTALCNLDGEWVSARVAWRGTDHFDAYLEGGAIAFIRDGGSGEWLAIVPAKRLLDAMADSTRLQQSQPSQQSPQS